MVLTELCLHIIVCSGSLKVEILAFVLLFDDFESMLLSSLEILANISFVIFGIKFATDNYYRLHKIKFGQLLLQSVPSMQGLYTRLHRFVLKKVMLH